MRRMTTRMLLGAHLLGAVCACDNTPTVALPPPVPKAPAPLDVKDESTRREACRRAGLEEHKGNEPAAIVAVLGPATVDTKDKDGLHVVWAARLPTTDAGTPCAFVAYSQTSNSRSCSLGEILPDDNRYNACVAWSKGKYMAPPQATTTSP